MLKNENPQRNIMVKSLSKVLYHGAKIFVKSLKKSIQQELELSDQLAKVRYRDRAIEKKDKTRNGMSLEEAQQILNLTKLDSNQAEQNFKHLFAANKGLKYLQSKVYRAKEAVDMEFAQNQNVKIEEKSKNTLAIKSKYVLFTYMMVNDK